MRARTRSSLLLVVLCVGGASLPTTQASADTFGPIALVSASGREQAGFAHDVAISGNGRYVVFDGVFEGKHGVWRRDLATSEVAEVAGNRLAGESDLGDAALPSISENGQYVSFTTTAALTPKALSGKPTAANVFVRNMDLPESAQAQPACEGEEAEEAALAEYGQSCPFTLVSAVNGKSEGLTYGGLEGSIRYGAVASSRSAISADGRQVAFVTTATSNLLDPASTSTPAMQVVVRDTATRTTQLVSVRDEPASGAPAVDSETGGPEAVEGGEGYTGAAYSDAGSRPPEFRGPEPYALTPPLGASISADGSTVAWLGVNIAEQAKVLPGEAHLAPPYTEPLWRRVGDGPGAPTRRITGGSDPESPACQAAGEQVLPETSSNPCQGPFYVGAGTESNSGIWKSGQLEDFVPQLSADGYKVAFLAQAPTLTREEGFARGLRDADLYVADMHGGLTRTEALQPLTQLASGDEADIATTGSIVDLGISPDGTQVAFSTQRTQFPLGVPAYVSTPMAEPGMSELFDVDLSNSTLTRVTQGFEGGPSEHPHQEVGSGTNPYDLGDGALSPSFADGGNLLAFASTAANLVYGDGNTPALVNGKLEKTAFDGSDAFVVGRIPFVPTPTETYVSVPPSVAGLTPSWQLGVTAASLPNGDVRLYVTVPGTGRLSAGAEGVVKIAHEVRGRSARPARKGRGAKVLYTLATRRVASAAKTIGTSVALVQLTLAPASPYASLAHARGGLPASVTVSFAAAGHRTLTQTLTVLFRRIPVPAKRHRRASKGTHR
jgi:hypothetical protein